jgi:hypothetical protein
MHHTTNPLTRRSLLQGGLLTSLALVAARGVLPIRDIAAEKKTKQKRTSVQSRNQSQRELCEQGGGTLEAANIGGGSWETTCHGGASDGRACTNTKNSTICVYQRTEPDAPSHPLEPDPPTADPGDGPTHPLEPDSPLAQPGDAPTQPLEPADGGITLTAYHGGMQGHGRQRAKQRRQHRKGRKG